MQYGAWLSLGLLTTACVNDPPSPESTQSLSSECESWGGAICGDAIDDDCDGADETCPTTRAFDLGTTSWDCVGEPPPRVVAWARFPGKSVLNEGACLVVFEGAPQEYYVKMRGLVPIRPEGCPSLSSCICPASPGIPSRDERLHAFSVLPGDTCAPTAMDELQPGITHVPSTACRRNLLTLYGPRRDFEYVATGLDALKERFRVFSRAEIACAAFEPESDYPFTVLSSAEIEWSPAYQPLSDG